MITMATKSKDKTENAMFNSIYVDKITLNIGAGKESAKLEKAVKLLQKITGRKPIKTVSGYRIAGWGIREGLPIGCKVTIRGAEAKALLKRLLEGVDNKIKPESFDNFGNFSFGIKDYIEIANAKYDPEIGMMGLDVCVSLRKKGGRVALRQRNKAKIGKNQIVHKIDAINYIKSNFNVIIGEEEA